MEVAVLAASSPIHHGFVRLWKNSLLFEDIGLWICGTETSDEDTPIEMVEVYVY